MRNLGTIGGSLAHADPSGDLGSVMPALGATTIARSRDGEREIAATDLADGPFQRRFERVHRAAHQGLRCRRPALDRAGRTSESKRKVGDFATVAVAVSLTLENDLSVSGHRIDVGGTDEPEGGGGRKRAGGVIPGDEAWAEAGRRAAEEAEPTTDVRGSAEYKRHMVDVYVRRGLAVAAEMAGAA